MKKRRNGKASTASPCTISSCRSSVEGGKTQERGRSGPVACYILIPIICCGIEEKEFKKEKKKNIKVAIVLSIRSSHRECRRGGEKETGKKKKGTHLIRPTLLRSPVEEGEIWGKEKKKGGAAAIYACTTQAGKEPLKEREGSAT